LVQLEGLVARQPVLMVWEDVHWSDPTTRESLDLIIDRLSTLRVLMILTFRPEFTPPWIGRSHVTMLYTQSPAPPAGRRDDPPRDRRQGAAKGDRGPDRGSDGRRSVVHRQLARARRIKDLADES
jgi:hypothetical protein